ncbi:TPA: phage tail protein [Pasteurella multocida]|uniref:phage tail-collar fiber domain-containing protein n=1 Tax=Pasteurella multocida TaxID=747 RepID=UPI0029449B0A|nr:phage tail protein [Pasteurella multocida]HDR1048080.1 phage tail protein [Pasteurella multocida]HDR1140482.1 phage tail protein [Pasteurella multocida]HED4432171.1 phage tail protein [Pasteurella multocida]HEP0888674.1 phage tail protein [Pasteurella multocida]
MAKQYYSVLTTYGSQQLATAIATRQPLNITHFAVGDGNGQTVTPNVARTSLVREVYRATISAVSRDPRNNKQVIFELTIPENVGGFHIREMGIFDNQNKLIAYANCPESFKPTLSSGSGKIQVMRMILLVESSDAVTMKVDDSVIFVTRGQLTPKKITAESQNGVDNDGHSHEIESASTTVKGIVQLTDELDLNNSTLALTAKAGKTLAERIIQAIAMFSNYIPNSKKSSAVNSNSEDTIGTSKAVKIAYDRAIEAEKKGLPIGAVLGFPKEVTNPQGFLKCDGSTFGSQTFPDLYRALGNKNKLPNLQRSDVGMTAYFATDAIPDGWIAFDSIRTTVTQQNYPELYQYLVEKYGAISNVPLAEDRFIRNSDGSLIVGHTQGDAIRNITGEIDLSSLGSGNQFLEFESSRNNEVFKGAILPNKAKWTKWTADQEGGAEVSRGFKFDASTVVPTANENRPKAIVLKFCIKAKNTFDDVQFWIKAFGEVVNVGSLDVVGLAQNVQQKADRNHTHQVSDILNFNQEVLEVVNDSFSLQKIGTFEIRKYHDGTMIQTNRVNLSDAQVNSKREFNWAVSFTERPVVVHSLDMGVYRHNDVSLTTATVHNESTNTKCVFATREWTATFQTEVHLIFIAIGRWK